MDDSHVKAFVLGVGMSVLFATTLGVALEVAEYAQTSRCVLGAALAAALYALKISLPHWKSGRW